MIVHDQIIIVRHRKQRVGLLCPVPVRCPKMIIRVDRCSAARLAWYLTLHPTCSRDVDDLQSVPDYSTYPRLAVRSDRRQPSTANRPLRYHDGQPPGLQHSRCYRRSAPPTSPPRPLECANPPRIASCPRSCINQVTIMCRWAGRADPVHTDVRICASLADSRCRAAGSENAE